MAWTFLIIAGCLEVVGVIALKRVAEKSTWTNNIMLIVAFAISFQLLSLAIKEIPLSTAYAVWTGIGTLGSTLVGMIFYREPRNTLRIVCIFGIIVTVLGLKLIS